MTTTYIYKLPLESDLRASADFLEKKILQEPTAAENYIELMVLYWQSTDYGLSTASNLSVDFMNLAGRRLSEIIESAEKYCPGDALISFWVRYIKWIDLGEPFELQDCRNLLSASKGFDPAFMLFLASDGLEARQETMNLLDLCANKNSLRCGYIRSVVDGVLKRERFRNRENT